MMQRCVKNPKNLTLCQRSTSYWDHEHARHIVSWLYTIMCQIHLFTGDIFIFALNATTITNASYKKKRKEKHFTVMLMSTLNSPKQVWLSAASWNPSVQAQWWLPRVFTQR